MRMLLAYQWATPGKKLLFQGGEIGVWNEWNHDHQLDWAVGLHPAHAGIARLVGDLNRIYRQYPAMHVRDCDPVGFQWLVGDDRDASVFVFMRTGEGKDPPVIVAMNATPVPRHNYRIGVPSRGFWKEILNSDAGIYHGSGMGNQGGMNTDPVWCRGFDQSIVITIPPLAVVMFTPEA
jgi:1,4-alpha-glucan branching enzyme